MRTWELEGKLLALELRAPEWQEMKTLTHLVERGNGSESHMPPLRSSYLYTAARADECPQGHCVWLGRKDYLEGVLEEEVLQEQPALTTPMALYSHGPRS